MSGIQEVESLSGVINGLSKSFESTVLKNRIQRDLFGEYIKIFDILSHNLANLANKINEEILASTSSFVIIVTRSL
jgi:hypothetical protein